MRGYVKVKQSTGMCKFKDFAKAVIKCEQNLIFLNNFQKVFVRGLGKTSYKGLFFAANQQWRNMRQTYRDK